MGGDLNERIDDHQHSGAADSHELLQVVYAELRELAAARLDKERTGQTLQPTALVHEAYIRLVNQSRKQQWDSPAHFFGAAAEAMRRILVERARAKQSKKRGGNRRKISLENFEPASFDASEEILAVHEALDELQEHDRQAAELVKLRFFAGLGHQESAVALGISRRAADRLWVVARAWLFGRITDS